MQRDLDRRIKDTGHENAYFPLFIPLSLLRQGGRARRGLRQGDGGGHPPPAEEVGRRQAGGRSGRQAGGAAGRAADLRDDHRRRLPALDQELSRPAAADQPVGQRGALGNAHAPVPAHHRVPLAGGPHRPRRRGRGARTRRCSMLEVYRAFAEDDAGDAGDRRREAGERALPRRRRHLLDRGDDAGRQGAAGRHLALPRPELRPRPEHPLPERRRRAGVLPHDQLGRLDAADRRRRS